MGISKGTKLTDNPKSETIKVRLDERTVDRLNTVADFKKITKSEVIRQGIDIQFKAIDEK